MNLHRTRRHVDHPERLEVRSLLSQIVAQLLDARDGIVLTSKATIAGQTDPGALVRLESGSSHRTVQSTRASQDGTFQFLVKLEPGIVTFHLAERENGRTVASTDLKATRGDVLLTMNGAMLDAIRAGSTNPPMAARNLAMVQSAVDQAIESRKSGSQVAAAAQAADEVADSLYPQLTTGFDTILQEALASIPSGKNQVQGRVWGDLAARAILQARSNDGANDPSTDVPGTSPGDWVPTPPKDLAAIAPQFAHVRPFLLKSPDQFLPPPPPALNSAQYATDLNQVESLGALNSTTRTPDQTAMARFWSDTTGNSFTPPGHWNQIAETAAIGAHMSLTAEARLFAKLDIALADAGIASWNAKYTDNRWRPVTAIREANLDGNAATTADPTWTPLWVTPAFPSYVSGHSDFSGAAQIVLESVFGTHHSFTDTGDPTLNLPARHFDSFEAAADEAGFSRVVGGIHFESDNLAGLAQGRAVARYDLQHFAD